MTPGHGGRPVPLVVGAGQAVGFVLWNTPAAEPLAVAEEAFAGVAPQHLGVELGAELAPQGVEPVVMLAVDHVRQLVQHRVGHPLHRQKLAVVEGLAEAERDLLAAVHVQTPHAVPVGVPLVGGQLGEQLHLPASRAHEWLHEGSDPREVEPRLSLAGQVIEVGDFKNGRVEVEVSLHVGVVFEAECREVGELSCLAGGGNGAGRKGSRARAAETRV